MTYLELTKRLTAIGADVPAYEATEMIRVILGHSREWCTFNKDAELPKEIDTALDKREQGVPLQYILGEAWFYGNRFHVTPDCLIPQPDTEHAVALSLKHTPHGGHILDICTGSGCIAISILKEDETLTADALDISEPALDIAKRNANDNAVSSRITFTRADALSDDISELIAKADVIVSNPPYINSDVIDTLSAEVRHEPRIALDGGADGMTFYAHFIRNLTAYMKTDAVMVLEIGYDQSERILELCREANLACTLHRDFGGNIRVAVISRNGSAENE